MKVFVLAESRKARLELTAGARPYGEQVEVIVIGNDKDSAVADKIWSIPAQEGAMFEDYTETVAALLHQEQPQLLLVEPTKRCKLMAGRLAAMAGTSVMTDLIDLTEDGVGKHLVYGGAAIRKEKAATSLAIVMVGPGVLSGADEGGKGEQEVFPFVQPSHRIQVVSRAKKEKSSVDLASAKRVIGVGRGIAKEEDLGMIRELAAVIHSEVGCSRPIAEAEKWLPKETYIGVSGLMLAPEVYVAVGISGQVQHTVGMNRSKVVIAINKDKNAAIFAQADYGIVGDLYKVVPALIEQLK
ncbi:electron transfer flavoprotein alpha subunit apoprotein [Desulfitobacterium sp. LBE]|uniref:Electron transfer flavoprotein alpha subunit n=2 Tax=root TaxID=1 RepID=B8G0W0_DESHD|nr:MULTISPECIES: FAD-binding protein [Desulfitobacterium]ACL18379.1 Electron transfer flavoprotein alpha subunit [Desulfitobacterium hafniense DCB-2]MEA5023667.1 FAD-binding protein [Desulfitobacterium hafniense]TWH58693.1 electron transfer flavoprotein alpha subunit apoprotein [Desulfitobacterium sp. LBE]